MRNPLHSERPSSPARLAERQASGRSVPSLRGVPFTKPGPKGDAVLLTDRQRQELEQISTRLRLRPRTIIYREHGNADWVFAVGEGVVKAQRDLPSGKRIVHAFLFARDLFGLAERGQYVNSAYAVTPVTLYRIPMNELTVLLRYDGDMQFAFLSKVTHELRESQRRATIISRRDAGGRLAMFVALMEEHASTPTKQGTIVPLPMSRSDIAAFLGLSLESVSRASAVLQRRGVVSFEGRHAVRITDPAAFSRIVAAV